jgi:hypothetical protein
MGLYTRARVKAAEMASSRREQLVKTWRRLIQHTTRKLHLTEAGETYYRPCATAIREIKQGEEVLQAAKGSPYGNSQGHRADRSRCNRKIDYRESRAFG